MECKTNPSSLVTSALRTANCSSVALTATAKLHPRTAPTENIHAKAATGRSVPALTPTTGRYSGFETHPITYHSSLIPPPPNPSYSHQPPHRHTPHPSSSCLPQQSNIPHLQQANWKEGSLIGQASNPGPRPIQGQTHLIPLGSVRQGKRAPPTSQNGGRLNPTRHQQVTIHIPITKPTILADQIRSQTVLPPSNAAPSHTL